MKDQVQALPLIEVQELTIERYIYDHTYILAELKASLYQPTKAGEK